MSTKRIELQSRVPTRLAGRRLDQVLAELFPDHSRSRLQAWVKEGTVTVDGRRLRSKDRVAGGEEILIDAEQREESPVVAQAIPLTIVYEDESLLVIDKPAGLVVHPAAGNPEGTLQNALLHHLPQLANVPRAGIVHRLDKETSGLLVVAKSLTAQTHLVRQLQSRSMGRDYLALVQGVLVSGGRVDEPIGRHPVDRKRQAVVPEGKAAVSHYRVMERFRGHTLIQVSLETGRTHQIRVHMAHIRHPLVGDPIYGGRARLPKGASETLSARLRAFRRQALHAYRLRLVHPQSGEERLWESAPPEDMAQLIAALREDALEDTA
ncbi:MAG: 23S rRNA pseudouridine(1911/1915/1917) synthase RluD [Gammaproteobacteria bacterium]